MISNNNISANMYQRLFLRPLGLNSGNSLVLWLLLISAGITVGGLWYFDGNVTVVVALLYIVGMLVLTILKPLYSLYTLVFLVLIFDQFGIPEFQPLTYQIDFFRNLKEISFIPEFPGGVLNPLEIHFLFLIPAVVLVKSLEKDFYYKAIPVWGGFILFFCCLLFSFFYGMSTGGDFLVALWEIRALFYLSIMYLLVPQLVRNKQHIQTLIWIFIIGISFKAFQGIGRFIELGFTTGGLATLTNHEDPVFTVTLLILLAGLLVYKVEHKQRFWLLLLLLPLALGFYVGMRRAAYASFMVSLATFIVLLPGDKQRSIMKYAIPGIIAAMLYGAAFWNSSGRLARPVQMIKSGLVEPIPEENYEDYLSNLYRDFENYDLARTVVNQPVIGKGFGQKYDQPIELVHIRFPLREYIPHNEIYWVLVKMGSIGFLAFWFFFNSFVARGVNVFSRLNDPYLKAVAMFIIIAVINQMVVAFFDLQLTYYRNMIYLGCILGMLPAVEEIGTREETNEIQITSENY